MSSGAHSPATVLDGTVVALCGGIGGAKLALGLSHVIPDERLLIAVNTGDDFEHLGLHISPDIDTVTYTLADIVNPETGWGRAEETWNFMEALGALGGETWFNLGDRDLAVHVERTRRLQAGETLSDVTRDICARLGITAQVLPMSDHPVRTMIETDAGSLPFQNYFVEQRCAPVVKSVSFDGAEKAAVQPGLERALRAENLRAVIICPSNPYLSIDPVLSVPGMRALLSNAQAPVVAVSPVVDGTAVKGPMAKIMGELGLEVTHATIAAHYENLIDGLLVDGDADKVSGKLGICTANTLMKSLDDRISLARTVLDFADSLASSGPSSLERIA